MQNPLDFLKEKPAEGSPRTFQIHHLEDFVTVATWLYTSEDVIFRGQRCDWPLVPSVGRASMRNRWLSEEQKAFDEFKREAIPYLSFLPENDWQWLAVAQHNRLPTRLLDWSKNPLVALWFAVSEPACNGEPGIVWAHSYREAIYATAELPSPFSIDKTFVYFPEHVFPYIQAQAGVFTVHHRSSESKLFAPFQETKYAGLCLTKIEIFAADFWAIRHRLFRIGINPASLFPGLTGLASRIKYENEFLEDEPIPTW